MRSRWLSASEDEGGILELGGIYFEVSRFWLYMVNMLYM